MTTLFQDNFDADTVGAIAPGWANKIGTWAVGTRNPVSGANTFGSTSDADGDTVLYTALAARADMQVETKQKLVSGGGNNLPAISHILRSDLASANHYAVLVSAATTTGFDISLYRRSGGSYSLVSNTNVTLARAVGDTFALRSRIVGSAITVSVAINGGAYGTVASFTDTAITAAGYPGLYYSKVTASMAVDDFVYDDAASAVTSPGAPTLGTATAGNATASFPYTAPSSDGGSAITGYSLTVYKTSDNSTVGTVATTLANPIVANGLVNDIPVYGKISAINNVGTGPQSAASNSVTPTAAAQNNALSGNTAGVLFSPYNWDIQASSAKTINAGAYFRTVFGGTSCTLNFDMTGLVAPLPQISYQVDRFGPWITAILAASIAITIPADTADYANKPGHLLEFRVKSMTETQARWSIQATAVKLTAVILDAGKTLAAPPPLPLKAIFYGDSITEGVRTVNMTGTNDTDRNDSGQGWSLEVARILGAEIGNVGFGATGFNTAGSGGVPALPSTYNFLYSGVTRSFASSPDFIVLMEGTNDSGDVTVNATTVLNGLIAATTAKIIVLRPFNGTAHASQLQAAIAACTTPARCTYVDTAGFFTVANSSDNLHPYGVENLAHIAPLVASAVQTVIGTGGTLITNSISLVSGRLKRSATGAAIPSGKRLRVS